MSCIDKIMAFPGDVGLYYHVIGDAEAPVLRGADLPLIAASVIKIPIMVTAFRDFAAGTLDPEEIVEILPEMKMPSCGALSYMHDGLRVTVMDLVTLMIILSDNTATNILIDRLTPAHVNDTMAALGIPGICLRRRLFEPALSARGIQNTITARGVGTLLERTWGDFLYNVYIFFGLIMTVIGAFLLYFITGNDYGPLFTTYYVSLSIFLGFAMTFPDQQLLFMFVFPIKIKYLALVDIIYLLYEIITYFRYGISYGLPVLVMIVSSLASTILFFLMTRRSGRFSRKRQRDFRNAMNGRGGPWGSGRAGQGSGHSGAGWGRTGQSGAGAGTSGMGGNSYGAPGGRPYEKVDRHTFAGNGQRMAVHHCAVCGRTELDDPDLEFRFCSKCSGNYEYCQDHLYTHIHVQ